MYKIQRLNTNTMVLADSLTEAESIARGDATMNKTALVISEQRGGRWYRIKATSKDYEIIPCSQGYEIREKNGKRWMYLSKVYNSKYEWSADYLYSKKYKTFEAALAVFKRLVFL